MKEHRENCDYICDIERLDKTLIISFNKALQGDD